MSQGISPTDITAIEAMPSAASDSVVAAVSSTHQQIGASPSASSSAALCTGLSSTRHDGEPLSQGISPATLTAITAVPSAASDGLVIASTVQVPVGGKVNRPAAAPAEPISGEPISAGASLATITAIEAMPSAAPDGMVIAGSLTQQHTSASRSTSSSAAMGTNLSSARCGGEPRSQGISPTTSTSRINSGGYTSRASRASRVSNTGRIRPHQAPSGPIRPYTSSSRTSRAHIRRALSQGISPFTITAITAVPSVASDGVVAAVSSTHQQISASRSASSSAALCLGVSSARHDGEPISQGISPTTITAIAAVPSAASDGVVAAVPSTCHQIRASHSAVAGHLAHLAHSYHSGALSGIGWLGHRVNCSITCRWQGQPSNRCHSHGCHCHLPESVILRA